MRKPQGCRDCPMWADGYGFTPDDLDHEAKVLVIGLTPTKFESSRGELGVSAQSKEYKDTYERYARLEHISRANVLRCRPQGVPLPTGKLLMTAVQKCRQYDHVPSATELILYQGYDVTKILRPDVPSPANWRGYLLPAPESESV